MHTYRYSNTCTYTHNDQYSLIFMPGSIYRSGETCIIYWCIIIQSNAEQLTIIYIHFMMDLYTQPSNHISLSVNIVTHKYLNTELHSITDLGSITIM